MRPGLGGNRRSADVLVRLQLSQDHLDLYKVLPKYIGTTSAIIGWMSNLPADSRVEYGQTTAYAISRTVEADVITHTMALVGLLPGTTYHVRVGSQDMPGNDVTCSAWPN